MILSKRERYIGFAVVAVLGALILDRLFLTPLTERNDFLIKQISLRGSELKKGTETLRLRPRVEKQWNDMITAGIGNDAATAQKQLIDAVQAWATESGLASSATNPQREEPEHQLQKIVVRTTYTGRMESITRFIGRINGSSLPMRISDMTINTKKEGTDDLTLQIGISTIFLAPATEKKAGAAGSREERS